MAAWHPVILELLAAFPQVDETAWKRKLVAHADRDRLATELTVLLKRMDHAVFVHLLDACLQAARVQSASATAAKALAPEAKKRTRGLESPVGGGTGLRKR